MHLDLALIAALVVWRGWAWRRCYRGGKCWMHNPTGARIDGWGVTHPTDEDLGIG